MSEIEYNSWVLFKIKSELTEYEYKEYVYELMRGFLSWVDPTLKEDMLEYLYGNGGYWNQEGGIGGFRIKEQFISHCKMYYFDETESGSFKRSILFRDHDGRHTVMIVFLIADSFEKYLLQNKIPYERENRKKT